MKYGLRSAGVRALNGVSEGESGGTSRIARAVLLADRRCDALGVLPMQTHRELELARRGLEERGDLRRFGAARGPAPRDLEIHRNAVQGVAYVVLEPLQLIE